MIAKSKHDEVMLEIPDGAQVGDRIPVSGYVLVTLVGASTIESFIGREHQVRLGERSARFMVVLTVDEGVAA